MRPWSSPSGSVTGAWCRTCSGELGQLRLAGGDLAEADDLLPRALEVSVALRDGPGEALARHPLGDLQLAQGRPGDAFALLECALSLAAGFGMPLGEARMLTSLAAVHSAEGAADVADETLRRAYTLLERLGAPEAGEVACRLGAIRAG